jgi:hypothetical protein
VRGPVGITYASTAVRIAKRKDLQKGNTLACNTKIYEIRAYVQ